MALACLCFAGAPFLGTGDVWLFALVCIGTGLALGADVVLPAAMQADVIDIDAERSGQERAGLYLGLWALATKLALAGAVGLAFPLLAQAGFDPAAGRTTPEGLQMLALPLCRPADPAETGRDRAGREFSAVAPAGR